VLERKSPGRYITGVTTARSFGISDVRRRVSGVEIIRVKKEPQDRDEQNLRKILTSHNLHSDLNDEEFQITCETLVNCLGAWSPIFSAKIGVHDVSEPARRWRR
jgi:glycine/D-amino acid oxidase-like deaminating enzyme